MTLDLIATKSLGLHQMDVIIAFLHGNLNEKIYIEHPEGCVVKKNRAMFVNTKEHFMV